MSILFAPALAIAATLRVQMEHLLTNPPPAVLLLSGPEKVGKYGLSKALAKAYLCKSKSSRPCGQCQNCLTSDLAIVELLNPLRANVKVETVRDMRTQLETYLQAQEHLFVIIEAVDRLSDVAANLLLKQLEEPPAGVCFLLTADMYSHVLPTVQSRSRNLRVPLPEVAELERAFSEGLQPLADAQARVAASRRLPGRLAQLLDEAAWEAEQAGRVQLLTLARGALPQRLGQALTFSDRSEAAAFLERLAFGLSASLTREPEALFPAATLPTLSRSLEVVLRARKLLDQNGSRVPFIVENAFANLPEFH